MTQNAERVAVLHTVTITITTHLPLDESDDGLASLAMYAARDVIDPEREEADYWFSVQHNDGTDST